MFNHNLNVISMKCLDFEMFRFRNLWFKFVLFVYLRQNLVLVQIQLTIIVSVN